MHCFIKRTFSLFILFLFFPLISYCQKNEISISGQIKGLNNQSLILYQYHGDQIKPIDTITTDTQGNFLHNLSHNVIPGLYNLSLGNPEGGKTRNSKPQSIDLVINNENIRFTTLYTALLDSIIFHESLENQLWYEYLKKKEVYRKRTDLLNSLQLNYPLHNAFYDQVKVEQESNQKEFNEYLVNLNSKHSKLLACRFANLDFPLIVPNHVSSTNLNDYQTSHFWDHVDFTDSTLVYSDLFAKKIIDWFGYFNNKNWDKFKIENEFIKATEILMNKVKINPTLLDFSTYYLFEGFDKLGFSMALCKLASFNTDESCSEKQFSDYFAEQLNSYTAFGIGNVVPDIDFVNAEGISYRISDIQSEYTLLLFWGTWCPHCEALLPKIRDLYNFGLTRSKMEVLAFAVDTSKTAFNETIQKYKYNWLNTSDFKGWESPIVAQYHVFATPTLIILDKNRKVISRPTNFDQLLWKVKTLIQP